MPTLRTEKNICKLKTLERSMVLGQEFELRLDLKIHSYCCLLAARTFPSPDNELTSQQ